MPIPAYQKREWFSVSALVNASRCLRKFFYGSGIRLRAAAGEHTALSFGSAVHKALPELLTGEPTTALDRAMQQFHSVWVGTAQPELEDKKRNAERAKAMFYDFWLTHSGRNALYTLQPPPSSNVQVADKVSDWEVPFAISIPGLDVPLVGRIDALVRHRDTGKLWGLEWKTSSELSDRFLAQFDNNPQVLAYTLALRTLTNEPIEGVMVEGLRVSNVNAENICRPIYVPEHKLEGFIKWARFWGNMVIACEQNGNWPQNYPACNPYSQFGMPGYNCEFAKLCEVPDWTTMSDFYVISNERPFVLSSEGNQTVEGGANASNKRSLPVMQPASPNGQDGFVNDDPSLPRLGGL